MSIHLFFNIVTAFDSTIYSDLGVFGCCKIETSDCSSSNSGHILELIIGVKSLCTNLEMI